MNRPPTTAPSRSSRSRYGKEVKELQDALNQNKIESKRDAIRKIIDAMTRGKDVSMLFPDVAKNMETLNLELKKLVYLYIINYAKIMPDLAIMAINSFRKDARDKTNPFLRALAIRTMGCIRVKQITEYLLDPLKESIKDEDSYVRKTAAICISKLYDVSPELIEQQGLLKLLESLLNDGNAMVVSNAVCALLTVQESKGTTMLQLNPYTVQKILTAMNECNEWGVIYCLDALAMYVPEDAKEAEAILERVNSRLNSNNPGVVLSVCKITMKFLDFLQNPDVIRQNCLKMTAPLISLLSLGKEPEIQYVALKNINIIIQKRPMVIEKEIKIFFCNFNDPIYIKLQKLEILAKLANLDNIQQILHELKDYTQEVDVEFVRKSVRVIGRCAIKLEKAAEKCVQALWECLKTKVNYIVMESIIVIRDIFRKYPRKYEIILKDLCENLKTLDEPESKASMVWIIGEYVDTIENADDLLTNFAENFKEEPSQVQNQILIAVMKLFLQRPNDGKELIHKLLKIATMECENPDLRDRAYIYWRLLSTDPELTKKIVFSERPTISDSSYTIETELLDKLVENIGNLSSIYLKKPESFVKKLREVLNSKIQDKMDDIYDGEQLMDGVKEGEQSEGQSDIQYDTSSQMPSTIGQQSSISQESQQIQQIQQKVDLLDLDDAPPQVQPQTQQPQSQPQQQQQQQQQNITLPAGQKNIKIPFAEVLASTNPGSQTQITGLQIEAAFQKINDKIVLELKLTNKTSDKVFEDFGIKFNNNPFKLQPDTIEVNCPRLNPSQQQSVILQINTNGPVCPEPPQMPYKVNVAFKTNLDVFYFFIPCSLSILFSSNGTIPQQKFVELSQVPNYARKNEILQIQIDSQNMKDRFENNYFSLVGVQKNANNMEMLSYSAQLVNGMILLLNVIHTPTALQLQLQVPHPTLLPLLYQAIGFILTLNI